VITNSSKSFSGSNYGFAKFSSVSNSTILNIGTPERFSDLDLVDKRIDLLLKTG
jgi:hypothetical protein